LRPFDGRAWAEAAPGGAASRTRLNREEAAQKRAHRLNRFSGGANSGEQGFRGGILQTQKKYK
jgi:hypothetical protein